MEINYVIYSYKNGSNWQLLNTNKNGIIFFKSFPLNTRHKVTRNTYWRQHNPSTNSIQNPSLNPIPLYKG